MTFFEWHFYKIRARCCYCLLFSGVCLCVCGCVETRFWPRWWWQRKRGNLISSSRREMCMRFAVDDRERRRRGGRHLFANYWITVATLSSLLSPSLDLVFKWHTFMNEMDQTHFIWKSIWNFMFRIVFNLLESLTFFSNNLNLTTFRTQPQLSLTVFFSFFRTLSFVWIFECCDAFFFILMTLHALRSISGRNGAHFLFSLNLSWRLSVLRTKNGERIEKKHVVESHFTCSKELFNATYGIDIE